MVDLWRLIGLYGMALAAITYWITYGKQPKRETPQTDDVGPVRDMQTPERSAHSVESYREPDAEAERFMVAYMRGRRGERR